MAEDWFKRPDYIINDRNLNSAISAPAHNERLSLGEAGASYTVKGYAYNGGGRRVTRQGWCTRVRRAIKLGLCRWY